MRPLSQGLCLGREERAKGTADSPDNLVLSTTYGDVFSDILNPGVN